MSVDCRLLRCATFQSNTQTIYVGSAIGGHGRHQCSLDRPSTDQLGSVAEVAGCPTRSAQRLVMSCDSFGA